MYTYVCRLLLPFTCRLPPSLISVDIGLHEWASSAVLVADAGAVVISKHPALLVRHCSLVTKQVGQAL